MYGEKLKYFENTIEILIDIISTKIKGRDLIVIVSLFVGASARKVRRIVSTGEQSSALLDSEIRNPRSFFV